MLDILLWKNYLWNQGMFTLIKEKHNSKNKYKSVWSVFRGSV